MSASVADSPKGNSEAVLLDLNFPGFQAELFDADPSEIKSIELLGCD
jgi:hypothetical protein